MIYRISDRIQIAEYLVMTWNAEPHRRRMIAMYDTLEDANFSVKWDNSGHVTGRENHGTGSPLEYRRFVEERAARAQPGPASREGGGSRDPERFPRT